MPYPPEDLAAYLDANLPDGVNVYGHPPDQFAVPAVVIETVDQAPYTTGGPASVVWGIEVRLVVTRAQPEYGLRALFDLRAQVTALYVDAPAELTRWETFNVDGTVSIGDADYLQGTLTTVLVAAD